MMRSEILKSVDSPKTQESKYPVNEKCFLKNEELHAKGL